jgi:hypothetical protein
MTAPSEGDLRREDLANRAVPHMGQSRFWTRKSPLKGSLLRAILDRSRVERMFGKLKLQRRIATRYDKIVLSFDGFLNLAAVCLWLKPFVSTA